MRPYFWKGHRESKGCFALINSVNPTKWCEIWCICKFYTCKWSYTFIVYKNRAVISSHTSPLYFLFLFPEMTVEIETLYTILMYCDIVCRKKWIWMRKMFTLSDASRKELIIWQLSFKNGRWTWHTYLQMRAALKKWKLAKIRIRYSTFKKMKNSIYCDHHSIRRSLNP